MSDIKSINAATNKRIQELAILSIDKNNPRQRKDMNELMSLILPKLRFYIWGFIINEDDTNDVLYNAIENICLKLYSYDPTYKFTTWVFNIAKNEALTWLNRAKMRPTVDIDDYFNTLSNTIIDDSAENLERELLRETVLEQVYSEIQRVSIDDDNRMLLEKDINKRKCKDIAVQYDMPENTVKTKIRAGRKRVRETVLETHQELRDRNVILEL